LDSLALNGRGRLWPLALIIIAIVISFLYLPLESSYLSFDSSLEYFQFLYLLILLAPLVYILGIVFIHRDKAAGKRERLRLSKLGGITLLAGGVSGIVTYGYEVNNLLTSNYHISGYYVIEFLLPVAGIVGSFLGSYYALKRKSFTGAMVAGSFSVVMAVYVWPLALIALALGKDDF
jgi:hypothetical protein